MFVRGKGSTIKINKTFQKPLEYIKKHAHAEQIYEKKEKKFKKIKKKFCIFMIFFIFCIFQRKVNK